jgi:hypothetical protein
LPRNSGATESGVKTCKASGERRLSAAVGRRRAGRWRCARSGFTGSRSGASQLADAATMENCPEIQNEVRKERPPAHFAVLLPLS